jgi:putative flippase GtrA
VRELFNSARKKKPFIQFFRYGLIGIVTNLSAYLVYLCITSFGGTPKLTMSLLYVAAAIASYAGNRQITFSHRGSLFESGWRFFLAHCFGYLINLGMLYYFVDMLGYPHQWVQVSAIFIVAVFLFITFKFFVFSESYCRNIEG